MTTHREAIREMIKTYYKPDRLNSSPGRLDRMVEARFKEYERDGQAYIASHHDSVTGDDIFYRPKGERNWKTFGKFEYVVYGTMYGSDRYGKCEVCDEHCSQVFVARSRRPYDDDGTIRYTEYKCPRWEGNNSISIWGHEDCVEGTMIGMLNDANLELKK